MYYVSHLSIAIHVVIYNLSKQIFLFLIHRFPMHHYDVAMYIHTINNITFKGELSQLQFIGFTHSCITVHFPLN